MPSLTLSAVSYLEVLQGIRNKSELAAVKKMLLHRSAKVIPVSETISHRAIELMELLTLSHGLQLDDALIAATAVDQRLPVLTANVRHFSAVAGLQVEAFQL